MSPTNSQLNLGARSNKRVLLSAPAFGGAPNSSGVVYNIAVMSPRNPNSARRTIAKVSLTYNGQRLFANIPGVGSHFLQPHSIVFVSGHGPNDCPGVNYYLVRGIYDFFNTEPYGRKQNRSNYGVNRYVNNS